MNAHLQAIGELLRTQDNRITQNPMFCVQKKVRISGLDKRWTGLTVWILDGEVVDPNTPDAEEYGYRDTWETVMVSFTEEGAKEYLRQNGHNLKEPRIYVESFNRCPEMIAIREYLISLPKPCTRKPFDFEEVKRLWLAGEQPCEREDGIPVTITRIEPHPHWGELYQVIGVFRIEGILRETLYHTQTGADFHGSGCSACNLVMSLPKPVVEKEAVKL